MTRSIRTTLALALAGFSLPAQELPAPATAGQAPAVRAERLAAILAGAEPTDLAELRALQAHVQELVARVRPATVSLGGASGVLVEHDGERLVLCAAHVTEKDGVATSIELEDGRVLDGVSLGADHTSDVSLIRVAGDVVVPTVAVGSSADLQRGQWVVMLGHPSGKKNGRAAPVRLGRVQRAPASGYIVTDCTMQGGDSGGPLFDMQGRVVGINSRINRNLAENLHAPVDAITAHWDELLAGTVKAPEERRGRGRRGPSLGLGAALEWGDDGAVVAAAAPGGAEPQEPQEPPAGAERLQPGDRLRRVRDRAVGSSRQLRFALRGARPGDIVAVTVERDGVERVVQVAVIEVRR